MLHVTNASFCLSEADAGTTATPLFAPLSLSVAAGDICLISAPSGAGKTTLLRWIAGMPINGLHATGNVSLFGKDVTKLPAERRRIGILFQTPLLFPHLCIADNISFGLARTHRGAIKRVMIEDALEAAGLAGFGPRDPATLSGGQQSRVALLRTLLAAPEALLLDEPFASLDDDARTKNIALLRAETKTRGVPTLLVSHDPRDAALADMPVISLSQQQP